MVIETRSPKETFEFGKKIGELAKAGEIYTLIGDLGVGTVSYTHLIFRSRDGWSMMPMRSGPPNWEWQWKQ